MYPELKGKVAIVTGSGRPAGLGEAIAKRLAAEGAKLVIHDIGKTKGAIAPAHGVGLAAEMDQVAAEIRAAGGEATTFMADMLIESEVEALVAHAVATFGRVDILVNNAGIGYLFGPILEMPQDNWDAVLGVNLRGCFFAIKHAVKQMMTQEPDAEWGRGRVVSIASQAAKSAGPLTSSYSASKHGLVGLTRSSAAEFGPHGITVNAVCPNHVTTGLGTWQNDFMSQARGLTLDEYMAAMRAKIPLRRNCVPADVAKACAFLCSAEASYITAEAMNVSGGEEYH